MNLVEEKQKVGKQESTTSIKSILEKTLQREEIEIKYNCNPCNKLFKNKKDIQMHWHSDHQCALCQEIFTKNHQQFEEHLKKFHDMQKEHHQIFVDSIYFNKKNQKNIENVVKQKKLYLKKFHVCKFCGQYFIENHKQLENHLEKFHNIDEESFDRIFNDIKEICCQTNSNETQVGKRKILLKNFYQCNFCKQVFTKDHQKLKNHIKKFHKFEEEDFQNKSNKFLEENFSNKKTLKVIIRKLDDSNDKFNLNVKKRSMKSIHSQTKLINKNVSKEKKNKAEITHVKSMKKGNSTTSNDKRESECLSSNVKSIKKQNSTTSYISGKSKNQPKNKEKNVQSKKNFNNLDNNKIKIISLDVAKKVLQHLNEYDDSIKKRNSTTSNEKREFQCLSKVVALKDYGDNIIKEQNSTKKQNLSKKRNLTTSNKKKESQCLSSKRCSPIEVDALKEYDDNIIEEQNSTTACKKRKMERNLPSISINSQCQPRKDEEITQNLQ